MAPDMRDQSEAETVRSRPNVAECTPLLSSGTENVGVYGVREGVLSDGETDIGCDDADVPEESEASGKIAGVIAVLLLGMCSKLCP